MGEYQAWSRRARGSANGYGVSSSASNTQAVQWRGEAITSAKHPDTTTRRRRALELLVGIVAVPALIALATGSSTAWWVFVGMLPVFGIYLGVLLYARHVRAEREINVAFFGRTGGPQRSLDDVFAGTGSQLDEVSA